MSMQKCPVCEGRGTMPESFYSRRESTAVGYVTCKACQGRGIVFSPDPVPQGSSTVSVMYCDHGMNTIARQAAKVVADGMTTELRRHRAELLP